MVSAWLHSLYYSIRGQKVRFLMGVCGCDNGRQDKDACGYEGV